MRFTGRLRPKLHQLRSLPRPEAQRLTLQAALVGQHGLRLRDPAQIHHLDNLPNPLTALEVACLIHAGLQMSAPVTDSWFPLEGVYRVVAGPPRQRAIESEQAALAKGD